MGCCSFFLSFPQLSTILSAAPNLLFFFYRRVLIAMSFTTNPLPSFGSTLPAARNTMVARDFSLPFRRDVDTPWQAFSPPLNFRNPQNTRAQATFCYANDASTTFSEVDVETQSYSSVKEIPLRQSYGQKIADAVLRMLSSIRSFGRKIIRQSY